MEECAICLENMRTDISILCCFHKFHTNCIISWYLKNKFCPICRSYITPISICDIKEDNQGNLVYVKRKQKKNCCVIL